MIDIQTVVKNLYSHPCEKFNTRNPFRTYKHESGEGVVMEYCDYIRGFRKILVLKDCYRAISGYHYGEHVLVPGIVSNSYAGYPINGTLNFADRVKVTDADLNDMHKKICDPNTGTFNTEAMYKLNSSAAKYVIDTLPEIEGKKPCIPNIQTLVRIWCNGKVIDDIERTFSDEPKNVILENSQHVGNGLWMSSSQYGTNHYRCLYCRGYINGKTRPELVGKIGGQDKRLYTGPIIPVVELEL